jgi:quinol monooxygenase YgiN
MILVYGKYRFLDEQARPEWEASSKRFLEFGLQQSGNLGFSFGIDLFDGAIVHMRQAWETQEAFSAFTSTPQHDERTAETKEFQNAGHVERVELTFYSAEVTRSV